MGGAAARNKSVFARCFKAMSPIRVLRKARDLYVTNMLDCSGRVSSFAAAGCSNMGSTMGELPRSFSRSSSLRDDDYEQDMRELLKVASTKTEQMIPVRSYSVHMRRIDEDKPFEEDGLKASKAELFSRSRSYAQPRRWVGV